MQPRLVHQSSTMSHSLGARVCGYDVPAAYFTGRRKHSGAQQLCTSALSVYHPKASSSQAQCTRHQGPGQVCPMCMALKPCQAPLGQGTTYQAIPCDGLWKHHQALVRPGAHCPSPPLHTVHTPASPNDTGTASFTPNASCGRAHTVSGWLGKRQRQCAERC